MQEGSPLRRALDQRCSDTAMGRSLVTEVSSPCIATSCEGYTLFGWLHDYERRVRNGSSLVGSSSYIPQATFPPPDSPLPLRSKNPFGPALKAGELLATFQPDANPGPTRQGH